MWSKNLQIFTKRVNLKPYNDKLMDIYERNMTFDGPAYLSKISMDNINK